MHQTQGGRQRRVSCRLWPMPLGCQARAQNCHTSWVRKCGGPSAHRGGAGPQAGHGLGHRLVCRGVAGWGPGLEPRAWWQPHRGCSCHQEQPGESSTPGAGGGPHGPSMRVSPPRKRWPSLESICSVTALHTWVFLPRSDLGWTRQCESQGNEEETQKASGDSQGGREREGSSGAWGGGWGGGPAGHREALSAGSSLAVSPGEGECCGQVGSP